MQHRQSQVRFKPLSYILYVIQLFFFFFLESFFPHSKCYSQEPFSSRPQDLYIPQTVDLIVRKFYVMLGILLLLSFLFDSSTPESKHSLIYSGVCGVVLPSGVFVGFLAVLWMWLMCSAHCAKYEQW